MLYYILGKKIEKQLETNVMKKKRFLSKIGMKHIQSKLYYVTFQRNIVIWSHERGGR
jgi:hypothetical protein